MTHASTQRRAVRWLSRRAVLWLALVACLCAASTLMVAWARPRIAQHRRVAALKACGCEVYYGSSVPEQRYLRLSPEPWLTRWLSVYVHPDLAGTPRQLILSAGIAPVRQAGPKEVGDFDSCWIVSQSVDEDSLAWLLDAAQPEALWVRCTLSPGWVAGLRGRRLQMLSLALDGPGDTRLANVLAMQPELRYLVFFGPSYVVDAADAAALEAAETLESLTLGGVQVSGTDPLRLSRLPRLRELSLALDDLAHVDLPALIDAQRLEELRLNSRQADDATLIVLARSKSLRFIRVDGEGITEEGLARLQRELPACQIEGNRLTFP